MTILVVICSVFFLFYRASCGIPRIFNSSLFGNFSSFVFPLAHSVSLGCITVFYRRLIVDTKSYAYLIY